MASRMWLQTNASLPLQSIGFWPVHYADMSSHIESSSTYFFLPLLRRVLLVFDVFGISSSALWSSSSASLEASFSSSLGASAEFSAADALLGLLRPAKLDTSLSWDRRVLLVPRGPLEALVSRTDAGDERGSAQVHQ